MKKEINKNIEILKFSTLSSSVGNFLILYYFSYEDYFFHKIEKEIVKGSVLEYDYDLSSIEYLINNCESSIIDDKEIILKSLEWGVNSDFNKKIMSIIKIINRDNKIIDII